MPECGPSRRRFLGVAGALGAATSSPAAPAGGRLAFSEQIELNGAWEFRPEREGAGWTTVMVPHTWQIMPGLEDHYGIGWYRRTFDAPPMRSTGDGWVGKAIRLEFEAVFHSAVVSVNGRLVGQHVGKGYTAFTLDITSAVQFGKTNEILVKVDNSFDEGMLPRGRSSDWSHDGGIYRPVRLLVTPPVFIDSIAVEAIPNADAASASIQIGAAVRYAGGGAAFQGDLLFEIVEEASGRVAFRSRSPQPVELAANSERTVSFQPVTLPQPKLWHFDHPHLYRLDMTLLSRTGWSSVESATFGIRSFEARGDGLYLNGERVYLMGVERMAGSHPEYGMAEPSSWIEHDHDDLKQLNCVFTRVHWPQDRRVLDYCDRHGILIQVEVPAWGPKTFAGMKDEPSAEILENGLSQLREMIRRDRNHPSIFAWGLCNEINGQNPPAAAFARKLYEEAKRLDPRRLRAYASHSLKQTPDRDVTALMDLVEWNEYYESWTPGTPEDMRRNLDAIRKAFPQKPIIVSEYGYCACTADRPEGDEKRVSVLRRHDAVFRDQPGVAGLIFFCYNDYRTHVGDKGSGVLKQRVHGVVDVFGGRKPSFDVLRRESSPIEQVNVSLDGGRLAVRVCSRSRIPAYTLDGYKARCLVFGPAGIPYERHEAPLPRLTPGASAEVAFRVSGPAPVQVDVVSPTGFSVWTEHWKG